MDMAEKVIVMQLKQMAFACLALSSVVQNINSADVASVLVYIQFGVGVKAVSWILIHFNGSTVLRLSLKLTVFHLL